NEQEALSAHDAGAAFLCVQGPEAGAHRGVFDNRGDPDNQPLDQLLVAVTMCTTLPVLAAGGISTRERVRSVLASSPAVAAVQCGTVFLRCTESGARPAHKIALTDGQFTETVVTRAFSGRPARGLRNHFIDQHPDAPAAYPEVNNATRAL